MHQRHIKTKMANGLLSLAILGTMVTTAILSTAVTFAPVCPGGCTCADNNLTVDCSNRGLLQLPPISGSVTKLDLSGNLLGPMINGSFEHLRQLQEVSLSGNQLMRLQLCTFTGLLHLRQVDLHGNGLHSLPSALFADNGMVEYLDLSHNQLDALPDLLLHSLPNLKVLNVSHNQASQLKLGLRFQVLTHLIVLDLSHNPFRNASHDTFEMAENWDHTVRRSLDLSYCQLEHVDAGSLRIVPGLQNLSLAGNGLLSFDQVVQVLKQLENSGIESVDLSYMNITNPALFAEVRLLAIKSLDLSQNKIVTVPAATFGNIRSLQHLDISHNLLTSLDEGFGDLVNLLKLNMSHCQLQSFNGNGVALMHHLTTLDLSHNRLRDAIQVDFSPLHGLRTLDLSFNLLQSTVLPGNNEHLVTLNLASNDLTSLPSMANMRSLRYFNVHDNHLQTLGSFLFTEAENIIIANFSRNDLTQIDHRAFLPHSPEIIDLSRNFLTGTEYFSWKDTREVYLQNNSLKVIDQQTFYGMDRLEILDLRHNNLSSLHDLTFKFLTNLTQLHLSHNALVITDLLPILQWLDALRALDLGSNKIQEISMSSFQRLTRLTSLSLRKNRLETIPTELFEMLENLEEVDISGNPFHCACELLPLQAWLRETKIKVKQRFDLNITNMCVTPQRHAGKLVTQYTVEQFECNTKLLYMIVFGSIGAFGILVGVTASLVCHYYNRWRKAKYGDVDKTGKKHKGDADKHKNKGVKRVDLVRVSKKSDSYDKQEMVNGWVVSKQLVPRMHGRLETNQEFMPDGRRKESTSKQGPPRPPWPPRDSSRSRRESKERREDPRERERRESRDAYYLQREGMDRREGVDRPLRAISQMVPMQYPQQVRPREAERSHLLPQSVWRDRYLNDMQPMLVHMPPDRWENVEVYPTWGQPRRMYSRQSARYSTLPSHSTQRFQPYGPTYPYRHRPHEAEYIQDYRSRDLPRPPPNQPDPRECQQNPRERSPYYRDGSAPYRGTRERDAYYEEPRGGQNPYAHDYRRDNQHNYTRQDPQTYDYRRDNEQNYSRQDPQFRDGETRPGNASNQRNPPDRSEAENNRQNGNLQQNANVQCNGNSPQIYTNGPTEEQDRGAEIVHDDREKLIRRGTSDQQLHRRDLEYRNAMDNPVGPKTASSPMLAEEKTSDWL